MVGKMTTLEIELALMSSLNYRANYVVPNVTDMSFLTKFETDMLCVTKSGYATAIEIKVSAQDLKKDLNKDHIRNLNKTFVFNTPTMMYYYENLKYFYYCVPDFLQSQAEKQIPKFAGLIVAKKYKNSYYPDRIFLEYVKPAKVLIGKKWSQDMIMALLRLGTMRIFNLKKNLLK